MGEWRGPYPRPGQPRCPVPDTAVLDIPGRAWAFPARDAPVPGDPAPATPAVTELLSLPPHPRTATSVCFSFSSLLISRPHTPPRRSRARPIPRCRRSLRDRSVPAPFPRPEQRSPSQQPRAEPWDASEHGTDSEPRDAREGQTQSRSTLRRHRPSARGPPLPGSLRDRGAEKTTRPGRERRHLGLGKKGPPLAGSGRAQRID